MAYIYNLRKNKDVEVEIVQTWSRLPLKKEGWQFDWNKLAKQPKTKTYVLRIKEKPESIEGVLQLRLDSNMLIMDVIEIAPHNIGSTNKKYDLVAGCLIAFACRESFKVEGDYKGFLTFVSKTSLIPWYKKKYGATQALGQRMFIDDQAGSSLIANYLELN